MQVSGDIPTLPSLRPKPNPKPAPTQTLGLREGRVGMSPETWIDLPLPLLDFKPFLMFQNIVTTDWPLPKQAGSWVRVSAAKALGIVWRDRINKNATSLGLRVFAQPGTQQWDCGCSHSQVPSNAWCSIFADPHSNPVPPHDPKCLV